MSEVVNPKQAAAFRDKKPPLDLIERDAMVELAWAMKNGADKYGVGNYRTVGTISARVYVAAIMRHAMAWLDRENLDPDSGINHLAHVMANVNVLYGAIAAGTFVDDRGPAKLTSEQQKNSDASNERKTDISPPSMQADWFRSDERDV